MSSLLEQAIIDAKALKDAALKNAEQMVIEKYSEQIKDAVSVLLEQEEDEMDLGLDMEPGLGDEESEDTVSAKSDEEAMEDIPGSESGQVELDLDAIEKRIKEIEEEEGIEATDALQSDKMDHDDLAAGMEDQIQASPDADSLATETLTQLEEELENMFVDEIMESLKVDIKPQKSGWAGASNEELDLAVEQELARMQDDEVKEQLEALKGALKKLEESNTNLNKQNKNLVKENETLTDEVNAHKSVVSQLKEKFDAVNTSNAKLLYINRTLDCGSLNERQKKSIVEAIAKAEDAKEAKVIYETLQNTVETKKEKSPESLSEAVTRRSSLLVRSREEKRTTSADIFAERMQRLAGINKKDN
tara:strand:- start:457 stop:1539 length:1083 start_codon:yes stop_codon:yes gene_type:complete